MAFKMTPSFSLEVTRIPWYTSDVQDTHACFFFLLFFERRHLSHGQANPLIMADGVGDFNHKTARFHFHLAFLLAPVSTAC